LLEEESEGLDLSIHGEVAYMLGEPVSASSSGSSAVAQPVAAPAPLSEGLTA
jgi:hypothetical protein